MFGALSSTAHATSTYIRVTDVSQLKYLMESSGIVYFRNLNTFDNTVTGCCYAFFLDTTTAYGKSSWALIMEKMATGGGLWFYVSNTTPPTSGSPVLVEQVGDF
jgi:hypothetical protein